MSTLPKRRYTIEEYLGLERDSETKHEYYAGEIFAMGGASRAHGLIVGNINASLNTQLRGKPCEVQGPDMRVKVAASGLYTYPDVSVACGKIEYDDRVIDTLLNPLVIVEVLSPTTEAYDRGKKFELYRKLESLQEYLLVAQDRAHIEHYRRQNDGEWVLSEATGLDTSLRLPAIECQLALRDVYDKVDLTTEKEAI
jgi:Uma2 family endonuclease